ncbi:hypothetical protein ACU686_37840 [Yinghuangia aomiensis]
MLESMKMETVLRAPFKARLRECVVAVGSQVETGAALLRLEPLADTEAEETEGRGARRAGPAGPPRRPGGRRAGRARLGGPAEPAAGLRRRPVRRAPGPGGLPRGPPRTRRGRPPAARRGTRPHRRVRRRRGAEPQPAGPRGRRRPRVQRPRALPPLPAEPRRGARRPDPAFQAKLGKALGHYGVTELDRTPELEAAVFRVFLAQRRASADAEIVAALLREWLAEPLADAPLREAVGHTLEQLVTATQVRFPVVADLARGVVFSWFAQPLLRRNRARVYADVRKHLRHLDAAPEAADRDERIAEMVRSTEPLVRLLGQRLVREGVDNAVMLEVLTRRYYGNKALVSVDTREYAGGTFVVAQRADGDVASTAVRFDELGGALRGLAELADGNGGHAIDADIYLAWESQPDDFEAMAAALQEALAAQPQPDGVRRITATVAGRGGAVMHHHFTFRPTADGMAEDRLIRGLHPYIAQRMQMERWGRFDLTRLPSSDEEVYLYRCVSPDNAADERLVAFAQIRDLTELRDQDGKLVALPTTENTIAACVDAIRRAHVARPSQKRFPTNRIVVYVWPPIDFTREEVEMLGRRMMPTTAGAGLEEIPIHRASARPGDEVRCARLPCGSRSTPRAVPN